LRASIVIYVALAAGACTSGEAGPAIELDPCARLAIAPVGATADQLASIDDAIAMWQARGITGLVVGGDAADPRVVVEFEAAAATFHGYYDPSLGTVYINLDLVDRSERAVTIAHELGHAFGLAHVAPAARPSVMNPGNLSIVPNAGDGEAVAAIWGSCN
jgi:hypothetical protein